ncbi:MAG: ParB N-terminal domain-containing protein [Actinomycetaceae bacterium]|nr:ParB N-terminal domain-containing protein [Actinomycetaceae bacterium]
MKKKPRLPSFVTAVDVAKKLGIPTGTDMDKPDEETMRSIRASFGIERKKESPLAGASSDMDMSFVLLPIDEIEPYRYNPRTSRNPRYDEIKASIEADGITNMLTVTRRDKNGKYTTYGGGNTRLMIAKELAAAGDKRFANLHVIYKEWPGDAQIITAQLAENENRGDITFWEKACAVEQFRIEFEKESGKVLSSNALHGELKKRGLTYSPRTVQNFTFSIANFRPIGPWLRAKEVNETLRPAYSSLQALGKTFNKDWDVQAALEDVLKAHGQRLEAGTQPPAQGVAELDVQALIADWHAAVGKVLDTSAEHVQAMLTAQKEDSSLSAEALRNVSATPSLPIVDEDKPRESAKVLTLPRRAPAPTFKPITRDDDEIVGNDEVMPQPQELTPQQAQPNLQGLITPIPPMPQEQPPMDAIQQELLAEIKGCLRQINFTVPVQDVLCESDAMPFRFIVDFPATSDWATAGDVQAPQPRLRAALWRVLAAISAQLDKRVLPSLPDEEGIAFSGTIAKNEEAFRAKCEASGMQVGDDGLPLMSVADVALVFTDPYLTEHVIKLLDTIEKLRASDPDRAPNSFVGLFSSDENAE